MAPDTEAAAHGGRRLEAASRWGIPVADWLDLSTGINPLGWPVPPIPADCWQRLPEDEDGLLAAAAGYYGGAALLAVAGSQAAIGMLPQLRPASRVAVAAPSYGEHARAWQRAGHQVTPFAAGTLPDGDGFDVLVLANPNNPTGHRHAPAPLLELAGRLARRDGWLVVDEAFIDAQAGDSLVSHCGTPGLIVLRSLGKFFGLAGARLGFVAAWPALLADLAERLGPWTIASPTRWLASRALADRDWQDAARQRLARDSARLRQLLADRGLMPAGGCALFQWVPTESAAALHSALARRGILVRRFAAPAALRFGLPGVEADWLRLAAGLPNALADLAGERDGR